MISIILTQKGLTEKGLARRRLPDAGSSGEGSGGFWWYIHSDAVLPHTTFVPLVRLIPCLFMYLKLHRDSACCGGGSGGTIIGTACVGGRCSKCC